MPLPRLTPSIDTVEVQHTTLSIDALGRFVCSTWDEATTNSGPPFSVVVIGGGMYGAYLAAKIYRQHPTKRVLLLDAGSFLVAEHVQNLGSIGLNVAGAITPAADPGVAREFVWGLPWRGNVDFPGLAYCVGGKSLYWGGWCPRLTSADLAAWPASTAAYLDQHYLEVESETGVVPATDFIFGPLFDALNTKLTAAGATTANVDISLGSNGVQPAPLAVQGNSPVSGLFSFDKYSSVPLLIQAVRDDVATSQLDNAKRRLFVVPRCHAIQVHATNGTAHTVEVDVAGTRAHLPIDSASSVVFAASAVESTRLALQSFPTPLIGRNLMVHVRSDFTVRIRRAALPPLPAHVQTAAMLVRGNAPTGRFHIQVTASTSRAGSDELLYRMIPDLDVLDAHLANTDPDWLTITLRAVGETHGDLNSPIPNTNGNWINLSPWETDEFGVPRAYLQLKLQPADNQTWHTMDQTAITLAQTIAGAASNIEYRYDGSWQTQPFPLQRPFPEWHRGLGTTYHESGTLWMGDHPATSVTDPNGRFHHITNTYACDQALFPTVGSANPVLTGLTLAAQLADHLTN